MDMITAHRLLQTMIDYFEAGNKESDRAAKAIIEWDFDNEAAWQQELKHRLGGGEWSGLRAPEADIIAEALHFIQNQLS